MKFYYDKNLKYTNRQIISNLEGLSYAEKEYINIDSADTINGHIIYQLNVGEEIPTYVFDEENNRRWYVSGITQLRTGKFQISLIRDIISEGNLEWKNEQAYISAGTAPSINYNKYKTWGLPFTNTKINETPLIINGQPSYFVFYTNTQTISDTGAITESDLKLSSTLVPSGTQFDVELESITDYEYYAYINNSNTPTNNLLYLDSGNTAEFAIGGNSDNKLLWGYYSVDGNGNLVKTLGYYYHSKDSILVGISFINLLFEGFYNVTFKEFIQQHSKAFGEISLNLQNEVTQDEAQRMGAKQIISQEKYNDINNDVGKVFLDKSTNKLYRLNKAEYIIPDQPKTLSPNNIYCQNYISAIRNIVPSGVIITSPDITPNLNDPFLRLNLQNDKTLIYYFTEVESVTTFDFNFVSNVLKLPKSAVRCVNISSAGSGVEDAELGQALMLMSANVANLNKDTGQIIDIQYLPFSVATQANENIKVNNKSLVAEFLNLDDYYFSVSQEPLTNINKETDTIKLVSPSRATQFMWSPYNNDGNMNFNIKATIRPFSTVIYIRPQTTGLLMYNYDDKNCLIIEEDFSLTQLSSEWSQYVRQNRNYSNTFNREIQGREVERTWERRVEQAQAKSDEWTARNISAQKARAYTGNLPIISSIAGAIGTAWKDSAYMEAAQLDREYNEAMYQESLSLARDMFNYQLDNIKSQPTMPSKITTIDCKFLGYVYIEYYSTNPTEKQAIENYYYYNGNRIDDYGTFNDYWGNFVRGKIIIAKNYTQPELNELNRRLQAGIFTGGNA